MTKQSLPAPHAAFRDRLVARIAADARFWGLAAAGSYVTDTMDAFSDLDFQVVVRDAAYSEVMAGREAFAGTLGTLLAAFTGEHVGEPRLLISLYDAPLLHVDFKFVTLGAFETDRVEDPDVLVDPEGELARAITANPCAYPPFDPQWVEDRFWVWVHYGAGKVGRGELFEAIDFLAYLREVALAPLAKAIGGTPARASRFLEREAVPYLADFAKTHPPAVAKEAVRAAIADAAALYVRLREAQASPGLVRRGAAERAATAYLAGV